MEDSAFKPDDALKQPSTPAPEKSNGKEEGGLFRWVRSLLPVRGSNDDSLREAIEELIEDEDASRQSAVEVHERRLISNILQLRDMPVIDVMVPRADIVAIAIDAPREDIIELLAKKPHSRIPVYKRDMDNIIGVVHIKDMVSNIAKGNPFELKDIMREAMVVSPSMRVIDLLLQLRQSRVHLAFVVDEFGGIDGLITINDLIEAVVGEIDDEYAFGLVPRMIERPDGSVIADARYSIRDFEEKYGDVFIEDDEDEDVDTLGGLVTSIAGHVPGRGEIIRHSSGIEFEVLDADPRRVMRVRIRNLPKKESIVVDE
ncbi:MAG: hemolysin family protein [Pseudomonadota bacterium]